MEGLGFNVVSYANNHMYDKGSAGLAESKRVFDALPSVTVAGIYERGSYDDIPIREENGIRFAFLSYMEMTNVGSSGDTCGIYLKAVSYTHLTRSATATTGSAPTPPPAPTWAAAPWTQWS